MKTYNDILMRPQSKVNHMWIKTIISVISAIGMWIITLFSRNNPQMVERFYSSTIYPPIGKIIGWISGIVPISIAEILLMAITLLLFTTIILMPLKFRFFVHNFHRIFHYAIRFFAIMYVLFYLSWGLNYFREDYMDLSQMNKEPGTIEELGDLTLEIIYHMNEIRETLPEDENGVFIIEESFGDLSHMAKKGFEGYDVGNVSLAGNYGRAKPVLLSKWMSHTGVMGIYFPYTSEPNVNVDVPSADLPVTICHEMAHQRGFAKEEEANFIAYKACVNNPDQRFQYSGYYLAMRALMNDIYKRDKELHRQIYSEISDGVKRDMVYEGAYWKAFEGPIEKTVNNVNDNYLKANNQEYGVGSYSRVVQLLIGEYKGRTHRK